MQHSAMHAWTEKVPGGDHPTMLRCTCTRKEAKGRIEFLGTIVLR